jgi:hypothetical protein
MAVTHIAADEMKPCESGELIPPIRLCKQQSSPPRQLSSRCSAAGIVSPIRFQRGRFRPSVDLTLPRRAHEGLPGCSQKTDTRICVIPTGKPDRYRFRKVLGRHIVSSSDKKAQAMRTGYIQVVVQHFGFDRTHVVAAAREQMARHAAKQ